MQITVIGVGDYGSIHAFGLYATAKQAEERIERLQNKHPSLSFFWVKIRR
jgi:hypothetical protein